MLKSRRTVSPVVVALTALLVSTAAPAQAAFHAGYGSSATRVAKAIGCRDRGPEHHGAAYRTAVVCHLHRQRVDVLTFRSRRQQARWLEFMDDVWDAGYVAVTRGVVVTARNGNRRAAVVGARAIHGRVVSLAR